MEESMFVPVADWKAQQGISKLHLMFNATTNKFSLRVDNTNTFIRLQQDLVDTATKKLRNDVEFKMLITGDTYDDVCLISVKPGSMTECDSI